MKPAVVVDIGNSRIKWGRCVADAVAEMVALPPDDPAAWEAQLQAWNLSSPTAWALASVHRQRAASLTAWLQERGHEVLTLQRAAQLPLVVRVDNPDHVGIDRLLNAVAAWRGKPPKGPPKTKNAPCIIIDAGSAITVDLVDNTGVFRGGAILPGIRLMAKALHDYTDLLPLVELSEPPEVVGTSTAAAIKSGIFYAAEGALVFLHALFNAQSLHSADAFITGGDAELLFTGSTIKQLRLWPNMTLDGIRISAEAQP